MQLHMVTWKVNGTKFTRNYRKNLLYTTLQRLFTDRPISFFRDDISRVYPKYFEGDLATTLS